jgi:hypothetical protein
VPNGFDFPKASTTRRAALHLSRHRLPVPSEAAHRVPQVAYEIIRAIPPHIPGREIALATGAGMR